MSNNLFVFLGFARMLLLFDLFVECVLQYRLPFIACEIFICEVDIILRTLVEDVQVNVSIRLLTANVFFKHYHPSSYRR